MTKPRKVDRRVRRTRKLLGDALLALLLKRDYETITIQSITEQADLNRATFYLHYGTKEELLVAALEARFDELVARIDLNSGGMSDWDHKHDVSIVYEHVRDYAPLYKVLLGARGRAYVVNRIIDYIATINTQACIEMYGEVDELSIPIELVHRHMAGSLYALLSWWVLNDMPYSAEYMTNVSHQLSKCGIFPILSELESSKQP